MISHVMTMSFSPLRYVAVQTTIIIFYYYFSQMRQCYLVSTMISHVMTMSFRPITLLLLRRHDTVIVDRFPRIPDSHDLKGPGQPHGRDVRYRDDIIVVISPVILVTSAGQAPGATLGLRPRLQRGGGQHRQGATAARLTDGRASGRQRPAGEVWVAGRGRRALPYALGGRALARGELDELDLLLE